MTLFYHRKLDLPQTLEDLASKNDFEVAGHVFEAAPESLRPPRIVRVGLIQNKIVLPTTADIKDQRDAILAKIGTIIQAAAQAKVNIVCLQEAFSELLFRAVVLNLILVQIFGRTLFVRTLIPRSLMRPGFQVCHVNHA